MRILVTGASGFIGSAFIRHALLTSNGSLSIRAVFRGPSIRGTKRLEPVEEFIASGCLEVVYADLRLKENQIAEDVDVILHFAAKTSVDQSIRAPEEFVETNVMGTMHLLEDALKCKVRRFIHISTDEVYGQIFEGAHNEDARINPRNPYAASKAGADALVLAYGATYGMHVTVVRTENNYGAYQDVSKVIPRFIQVGSSGGKLPIYGDGKHRRQWLWVEDTTEALMLLLESEYESGQVFHVAGNQELTNAELARRLLLAMGQPENHIEYIDDTKIRPGHDRRYALSCAKIYELGWRPRVSVTEGLAKAVLWYTQNSWWFTC